MSHDSTSGSPISLGDLTPLSQSYLSMPKDVVDGRLDYGWPAPGRQLRIELRSDADGRIKFFVDINECRRSTSIVLGAVPARKTTSQSRAGDAPYVRIDMADDQDALFHRNPDGSLLRGDHIHLDIVGYGIRWAWPLDAQTVFNPVDGRFSIQSMFEAMLEGNNVTKSLRVNYSLGV